jgi:hypothetical protein
MAADAATAAADTAVSAATAAGSSCSCSSAAADAAVDLAADAANRSHAGDHSLRKGAGSKEPAPFWFTGSCWNKSFQILEFLPYLLEILFFVSFIPIPFPFLYFFLLSFLSHHTLLVNLIDRILLDHKPYHRPPPFAISSFFCPAITAYAYFPAVHIYFTNM